MLKERGGVVGGDVCLRFCWSPCERCAGQTGLSGRRAEGAEGAEGLCGRGGGDATLLPAFV